MNKLSLVFIAGLSIAAFGCKKKGGADCDRAINHSMDLSKADMQKMGVDTKILQRMKDLGVQHCKDDKWPDDAVKCMSEAKTETEAQRCYDKLSKAQQDKMYAAAAALSPPGGEPGGRVGSDMGSAGAGSSDMGSAAAGSAAAGAGSAAAGSAH